jgi:predicted metal-dependent phosphoesterase TrpH
MKRIDKTKAPRMIDLHLHSYFSDGENSPETILEQVKRRDISLFAITDHNFVARETTELIKLSSRCGIEYIQGVEVSSVDKITGLSLHILGYSVNFDIGYLNHKMAETRAGYNRRANKIIEQLNNKYPGINLDFEEILKSINAVYISRNVLASRLREFLGDSNIGRRELLKEVFVLEHDSWMLDSAEVIEIIRKAGGIAVLAHPGRLIDDYSFEILLSRLVSYGLTGIEIHYPTHTLQQIQKLQEVATKYELISTAGSDWHGYQHTPHINLGMRVTEVECQKIHASLNGALSR